jgi:hypothetical protein
VHIFRNFIDDNLAMFAPNHSEIFQIVDVKNAKFFQPFSAIHNSEKIQFLEHVNVDEGVGNFQPFFLDFRESICDFPLESMFLVLEIVWNNKIQFRFYDNDLQPPNSEQNFVSRSEISYSILNA